MRLVLVIAALAFVPTLIGALYAIRVFEHLSAVLGG